MSNARPTFRSTEWTITGFLDGAQELLNSDRSATELRLYFYAVTLEGWKQLRDGVTKWRTARPNRKLVAYIGTDHGLTDPEALKEMPKQEVGVRVLRRYNGVYHPKVAWFWNADKGDLLVGSNNLTLDGLRNNIEFATLTRLADANADLVRWHKAIHDASDDLTAELLKSYEDEKQKFGAARAKAGVAGTFTWSKRSSTPTARPKPAAAPAAPVAGTPATQPGDLGSSAKGDFIMEIMPLETGQGGSQVQVPMQAARRVFGLPDREGASISLALRNVATDDSRTLTMTRFANATARIVINELEYRHRPCLVIFRSTGRRAFDFEIVRESITPDRYRQLLRLCGPPTRAGSRRWAIVP